MLYPGCSDIGGAKGAKGTRSCADFRTDAIEYVILSQRTGLSRAAAVRSNVDGEPEITERGARRKWRGIRAKVKANGLTSRCSRGNCQ